MEALLSAVHVGLRQRVVCDSLPLMPHTSPFQCVEEILGYLKSCFSREPMMATVCVQQVSEELPGSPSPRTMLARCLALRRCCVQQPHQPASARSFSGQEAASSLRPWRRGSPSGTGSHPLPAVQAPLPRPHGWKSCSRIQFISGGLRAYVGDSTLIRLSMTSVLPLQLLKTLFGTNLASQLDGLSSHASKSQGRAQRLGSSSARPGLYHYCFMAPYTLFTQALADASLRNAAQAEQDQDTSG